MMDQSDTAKLRSMQQELLALTRPWGELADWLLGLRDELRFEDADWYNRFTQHVATLDSASTFHPRSDAEEQQLQSAIRQATSAIGELIDEKLA